MTTPNENQPAYPTDTILTIARASGRVLDEFPCGPGLTKLERACLDIAPSMISKHIDPDATNWDYNWIAAETKRCARALLAACAEEGSK